MSSTRVIFTYVYVVMCVYAGVHACTREWRPEEDVRCLLSLSTYSFEAGSLPETGACISVRLEASQPHSPVSIHIRPTGVTGICGNTHAVMWVLGFG